MSYIPNKAIPHTTAADPAPAIAPPAEPAPRRGDWLAVGGIAALVGIGVAGLGAGLVGLFGRK